ncbi:MAG: PqqD family protein [Paludibacter sp.]|jgi:hypothetical protein|nr:PqqD family protein [Paludibacter sp.]
MNTENLSKLKSRFVSREVDKELILVPLTGNIAKMNEMFTLNETAKLIWENMDKVDSEESLTDLITAEFEVSHEIASADVSAFIRHLETML